jgi:predicted 3-demethylubiquinone-9 3-methyltransferase (glyoxalase superfamily)
VRCNTQEEIDYFWSNLSADPKAGQCGWLKDRFGLTWQIVPALMDQLLQDKNEKKLAQVTQAFLKMKKFDIAKLKEAYEQVSSAV